MDQPGNHILLRGNQPAAADRMRELLARTVQDHVADQRSNAGALEDIRQRMEGLEWLVKEVREREIPGMTAQLDELARHLDETTQRPPQWAESLAEHIEVLRAQVAPVAELHSLWADVGTVSENVEAALPQLQSVCDTVGQAMEALRAQDDRLDQAAAERGQAAAEHGIGGGPVQPARQGGRRAHAADRSARQGDLGGQGTCRGGLRRAGAPRWTRTRRRPPVSHPVHGGDVRHRRGAVRPGGGHRRAGAT